MDTLAFRFRVSMRPTRIGNRTYTYREGLLLCDAKTESHWGEASPLPGFSQESIDDVIAEWRSGAPFQLPSLRFAMASIESSMKWIGTPVAVPVNALVQGDPGESVRETERYVADGFLAIKLKIGSTLGGPLESAELVARVRDVLPADRKLRLDANRAWCLRDAIEFGLRIQDLNVEYVEEPTGRPTDLEAFYEATQVPYALDETLREAHPLEAFPHSTALILKPTLLGDLAAIAQLTKHDKLVVISGAFESGVGTAAAARWSHVVAPGVPAGLEAHTRLRADVLTSRLRFDNGCLYVPASTFVCREQLSRVA